VGRIYFPAADPVALLSTGLIWAFGQTIGMFLIFRLGHVVGMGFPFACDS
jgi:hypothetical protein